VVGAFESVGAILVVAMLVVPAATAYLLTDRLAVMLGLAVGLGVTSAVAGYALARWWDASIAGAMATASGLLFAIAVLASPRHGWIARLASRRRLGRRLAEQLLLLHLAEDGHPLPLATVEQRFGWTRRRLEQAVGRLERAGWAERRGDGVGLTPTGAAAARDFGAADLGHPLTTAG
jgi:manganese/zinc/iron transport system permease protein